MSEPTLDDLIYSISVNPVSRIVRQVAEEYCVSTSDILGSRRFPWVVIPRQEAMRRAREQGVTLERIGRAMRRDHKTVLHGIRAATARLEAAK